MIITNLIFILFYCSLNFKFVYEITKMHTNVRFSFLEVQKYNDYNQV